jgi:GntR family transcriptional regulator
MGSGIYVRDFRPILREGIGRLGASTWPSGKSIWTTEVEGRDLTVDQIEVSEADTPDHIRTLLELPEGAKSVLRSRRFILDGKPVLISRSWLPAAIASGTAIAQADTGPGRNLCPSRGTRPRPGEVPRGPAFPDAVARRDRALGDRPEHPRR